MNIQTKYSLGACIWAVSTDYFTLKVKCEACQSTGKITIMGVEYDCPVCNGTGGKDKQCGRRHFVTGSGEVGKITFEIVAGKWTDQSSNYVSYFSSEDLARPDDVQIHYMLDSTGIGSGTLWKENTLFSTRQEAQSFCDSENAKLPKDEL